MKNNNNNNNIIRHIIERVVFVKHIRIAHCFETTDIRESSTQLSITAEKTGRTHH